MMLDGDDDSIENGDACLTLVSEKMDYYDWIGGYRVHDPAVTDRGGIIRATGNIIDHYPAVFIVDAKSMKIVKSTLTRFADDSDKAMDGTEIVDTLKQLNKKHHLLQ